jgi:hypothetical protein
MPIFVEWKWHEKSKSFLVIFSFIDDYTKSNLRISTTGRWADIKRKKSHKKAWLTWAPSHVELAMLSDLLHISNIVDGLQYSAKRKLRPLLEGDFQTDEEADEFMRMFPMDIESWVGPGPMVAELCEEYIEYLNKVVKPYIT